MFLGKPCFWVATIKQDWDIGIVTLKKGKKKVKLDMRSATKSNELMGTGGIYGS